MSHLSKIKTVIKDEKILAQTLSDLGLNWTKYPSLSESHDKFNYHVKQDKNVDLDFLWNDHFYEISTDIQLWSKNIPFEMFLNNINQKYAYNTILSKGNNVGFKPIKESVNSQGTVTLTLRRWQ
uniref:hypothetical protein n=1 Tax=Erythrolobus coxiae TaxID=362235 RepID=UPI001FCDB6F8|nr:hypothetical protein MW556_pgp157 [Erythrolobus coxiae]UNJ17650.1 hypothetical protein [Erythrolobus coxiae]